VQFGLSQLIMSRKGSCLPYAVRHTPLQQEKTNTLPTQKVEQGLILWWRLAWESPSFPTMVHNLHVAVLLVAK